MTAQGTRGMYCTLPNSPLSSPPDWRGAHAGEGLYNTRQLLQTAVYFDDVPPGAGGLTIFPGSHTRIWNYWEAKNREAMAAANGEEATRFVGYTDPPIGDLKADTEPRDDLWTRRLRGPVAHDHAAPGRRQFIQ